MKVIDQDRCIGCHACTTACKSENEVPLGVTRTYVKSVDVGAFPAGPPGVPGHQVQPVRGRALRGGLPDPGHVPAARTGSWTSTSRSASAARPAWRPARTTRSSSTRTTTRPRSATCARTGWRSGLEPACVTVCPTEAILVGDLNDPALEGGPDREPRAGHGAPAGEGHPARACSTRARTRPRSTRSRPAGPTAACSPGPPRAASTIRSTSPAGTLAGPAPVPRRCCPTTWRTTRRGAGGSACTPGPRASPPAPSLVPLIAGPRRAACPGTTRWPAGRRPRWPWLSSASPGSC